MKTYLIALTSLALLAATIGCANGPLRQWRRGAPCNTCNPQIQQPLNFAPACDSGCAEDAASTGFFSRWFRGNSVQQVRNAPTEGCGTGACSANPTVQGGAFANQAEGTGLASPLLAPANDPNGNANTVGRLELPPISFNDNN